jgi:hypothetical protein
MVKKKIKRKIDIPFNIFDEGGIITDYYTQGAPTIDSIISSVESTIKPPDFSGLTKPVAPSTLGKLGIDWMGSVGTGLSGALSIAQSGMNNAQIADTSSIEALNAAQRNRVSGASSNDELMSEWASWNRVKDNYTKSDVRGGSNSQRAMGSLGAIGQGVAAGTTIGGPIGGIIGGALGIGSSIAGWLSGDSKARKRARSLNAAAKTANDRGLASFETRAANIDTQNDLNLLANYSAYGGPLNYGSGAVGYEFDNKYLNNQEITAMNKQRLSTLPEIKTPSIFACGGKLYSLGGNMNNGVTFIDEGGSHEENPYQGIQIGVDPEGAPNLVEEGEVVYNDYVFSNRMNIPDNMKKEYKFKGNTFADAAKYAQKESEERPNDPISKKGLQSAMQRIAAAQEEIKQMKEAKSYNKFAKGGALQTASRYAPIVGAGVASLIDMFSSPDYDSANMVANVDLSPETVSYAPVSNYLAYNPLDRDYYTNKLGQQASATRRGIMNTSGGNRLNTQAGLLAADFNYNQGLGALARQGEEYNQQQRERVENFNRSTNMFNTETGLKAGMFNAESRSSSKKSRLAQAQNVAQMRQAIKDQEMSRRSTNISGFLQGLGDMGWENFNMNMINSNPALAYELEKSGMLGYKKKK